MDQYSIIAAIVAMAASYFCLAVARAARYPVAWWVATVLFSLFAAFIWGSILLDFLQHHPTR